jgi:hypothetical protein
MEEIRSFRSGGLRNAFLCLFEATWKKEKRSIHGYIASPLPFLCHLVERRP